MNDDTLKRIAAEECHGPLTMLEAWPPDYTGVKLCPDTVLWCPTCDGEEAE